MHPAFEIEAQFAYVCAPYMYNNHEFVQVRLIKWRIKENARHLRFKCSVERQPFGAQDLHVHLPRRGEQARTRRPDWLADVAVRFRLVPACGASLASLFLDARSQACRSDLAVAFGRDVRCRQLCNAWMRVLALCHIKSALRVLTSCSGLALVDVPLLPPPSGSRSPSLHSLPSQSF
jgi:hypothetical protein